MCSPYDMRRKRAHNSKLHHAQRGLLMIRPCDIRRKRTHNSKLHLAQRKPMTKYIWHIDIKQSFSPIDLLFLESCNVAMFGVCARYLRCFLAGFGGCLLDSLDSIAEMYPGRGPLTATPNHSLTSVSLKSFMIKCMMYI